MYLWYVCMYVVRERLVLKCMIIIIINSRESGNNSYAFCLEIPLIVPIRETNCFPIATGSKKYKQCYYLLTEKNKRF